MKKISSEDDFQDWAMSMFERIGHIQDHRHSSLPHVPDLSVAAHGGDMWLELKYGRFRFDMGPEGRDYEIFNFKEVTRGQLDWLSKRQNAGRALCGILGYVDCLPTRLTSYLFYMDGDAYLDHVWKPARQQSEEKPHTIGSIVLSPHTIPFHEVRDDTRALMRFLRSFSLTPL